MKKNYTVILALILALCFVMTGCGGSAAPTEAAPAEAAPAEAAPEEAAVEYGFAPGQKMEDFTFTTHDGKTMSLYEVLEEKDMVLLNFWASWCSPCRSEFPAMEEAYQLCKDDVEIFALDVEDSDTDEAIAAFVESNGMSFPVGRDSSQLYMQMIDLTGGSVPVNVVVDRFGTICFLEIGAVPSTSSFLSLFNFFTGDDYTESVVIDEIPQMMPNVEPLSAEELAGVLNVEGGELAFRNDEDPAVWSFQQEELDGRSVLRSSNAGVDESRSVLYTDVSAEAGDALSVSFKISSQGGCDLFSLSVNGEIVKSFSGERDWTNYAYRFEEAGEYNITIEYSKDFTAKAGEDCLWIDSVALLSGAEADAAVEANPKYPVADECSLTIISDDIREIVFNDPLGILSVGPDFKYYMSESGEIRLLLTLTEDIDPESVAIYDSNTGSTGIVAGMCDEGYVLTIPTADMTAKHGSFLTSVFCFDLSDTLRVDDYLFYESAEALDTYRTTEAIDAQGRPMFNWAFADEVDLEAFYAEEIEIDLGEDEVPAGDADYTVRYEDAEGNPVPGVTLQVCDAETCMVFTSDDKGECVFTLPAYSYELHTLKVPEGYVADTNAFTAPAAGGEIVIVLDKD